MPLPLRSYRSPRGLATVVRWLLVASILLAGADAAANAQAARLIGQLQSDANLVTLSVLEGSDLRVGAIALLDAASSSLPSGSSSPGRTAPTGTSLRSVPRPAVHAGWRSEAGSSRASTSCGRSRS